jgi:hypothetical protein
MTIAKYPHTGAVAEVVAVDEAVVAVSECELTTGRIDDRVVSVSVLARLVGDEFVLPGAAVEEVVLDQSETVRKAQPAQTETYRLSTVPARAGEVVEVVVMNPHAARDLAARSTHVDHIAERSLVAKLVEIDLRIIARDRQISAVARTFEEVAGESDVGRAGPDLNPPGGMGEQESLDHDVGGGARYIEPLGAGDLNAPDGLRDDPDRIGRCALAIDCNCSVGGIDAVVHDDDVAGHGSVDARLQIRDGVDFKGGGGGRSG